MGIYAVGKVEDEVGGGGLQGLIYGFLRSLWVSHQQVVTDSSAEKGIALRDIYEVLAGLRRDGMTGFKWMFGGYQEYLSSCGVASANNRPDERCLSFPVSPTIAMQLPAGKRQEKRLNTGRSSGV